MAALSRVTAAALFFPFLVTAFCGCTPSSVLSDVDREYYWQPARTTYSSMFEQCAGEIVVIEFRNGWIREGYLVGASTDSISWRADAQSPVTACATADLLRIVEPTHVVPAIVGTAFGACFGFMLGLHVVFASSESGGAHPVEGLTWPLYACTAAGGVAGYFIGRGISLGREYLVDTAAARGPRARGETR